MVKEDLEKFFALPAEVQAKQINTIKMQESTQEGKMKLAQQLQDRFSQHDVNKDGLLDLAEFISFFKAVGDQNRKDYGDAPHYTNEEIKDRYEVTLSEPSKQGVSILDIQRAILKREEVVKQLTS
jgi:hypothetical protein